MKLGTFSVRELSVRTLSDFETLAIKQGGCWCIFYQRANPLRRGTTSEEWKRRNRADKRDFNTLSIGAKNNAAIVQGDCRSPLPRQETRMELKLSFIMLESSRSKFGRSLCGSAEQARTHDQNDRGYRSHHLHLLYNGRFPRLLVSRQWTFSRFSTLAETSTASSQ